MLISVPSLRPAAPFEATCLASAGAWPSSAWLCASKTSGAPRAAEFPIAKPAPGHKGMAKPLRAFSSSNSRHLISVFIYHFIAFACDRRMMSAPARRLESAGGDLSQRNRLVRVMGEAGRGLLVGEAPKQSPAPLRGFAGQRIGQPGDRGIGAVATRLTSISTPRPAQFQLPCRGHKSQPPSRYHPFRLWGQARKGKRGAEV